MAKKKTFQEYTQEALYEIEKTEGVSLPETNKREQSAETKEAVRTMKRKKKHHGMEL